MALIREVKRTATILAFEDTHVLIIIKNKVSNIRQNTLRQYFKKVYFKYIIEYSRTEELKLTMQMKFFFKNSIFAHWSKQDKKRIFLKTTSRSYIINQKVFEKGDKCDFVYLIKSGVFVIQMNIMQE